MKYIVCITVGLPGVGKTCLKFLLMGMPPPELRSSTICAETPIRINVRAISEVMLRASGEEWIEVNNDDMLNIVAQMLILVAKQGAGQLSEAKVTKEHPLLKMFRWIKSHKRTYQPRGDSHDGDKLSVVVANEQQPSTSFKSCQVAVRAIMEKLERTIKRLRSEKSEEGTSQSARSLLESIWVYLSDCGGQPQYHELLPLFIQHISAALCVLRLPDELDKVQPVEYYSENQLLGAAQQSQLSAKDTVRCLVNTIQSFSTKGEKPKIILVGTHRDVLEEAVKQSVSSSRSDGESSQQQADPTSSPVETLEEKNQQLLEMLEPEFSDQLVYSSKDMKQLLYILNTLNPNAIDKSKATEIRNAVENSPAREVEVPIWWYIFERLLQELAARLGRKVLSKAECLEIANALGFQERHLEAALRFFDELNVIKYSPKVLPNVVFTESQVPLDKVSELVRESYLLRGAPSVQEEHLNSDSAPTEGKWKHFRDHGVINPELMKKFPRHYVPGIFTADDLSELLKELLVFAPIPTPEWEKSPPRAQALFPPGSPPADSPSPSSSLEQDSPPHFVMPASLVTLSEAELAKRRTSSSMAATLLVKFPLGSRRAGVFCCFAVHLIRHCGWSLLLDAKVPLYRNCFNFCLKKSTPPCTVTVLDSNSFIEVYAKVSVQATALHCARILPIVKGSIFSGIAAACRALKYKETYPEIGFICPHHEASSDSTEKTKLHSASVGHQNEFWCCDDDTSISGLLQSRHHIWFGTVVDDSTTLASPPATSQTSSLQMPSVVATKANSGAIGASQTILSALPRPQTQSTHGKSPIQSTPSSASHLPHIPEYISISAQLTEEQEDVVSKPTSSNLTVIRWRNESGEVEKFKLKQSIMHKWRDLGDMVVPWQQLEVWAKEKDAKECCAAVISYWLDHPPHQYPATWEGLYELLCDCELSQVATELKKVVNNAF